MRMYFLDSTEDKKHEYNQNDFARFHNQIIGTGVSDVDSLTVSAKNNMEIALSTGWIFANGFSLEIENTKTLEHDVAHPDNDRIDRVIVRFDSNPEGLDFYPVIKKGTPAKDPVAPDLTRDNYIYEMSVAQVLIKAGKSYVEDDEITDERNDDDVCGYIDLHNIYRGLFVNEYGMVTMPNQSYVEMMDESKLPLKGDNTTTYVSNEITIDPIVDKQKEVSNGVFTAKSDGVYQFYFHLSTEKSLDEGQKIESFLKINDNDSVPDRVYLFNTPGLGTGTSDINFMGSGIKELEEGDEVKLLVGTRNTGNIDSRYRRLSIAKLN